ncbi:hypothetical protein SBA1_840002 [Candidatus Sulfotelmatobacter kueseliae]|uniref:Uncharacterized protein n=1 Tax=Candidatus Sulfotelmatobacter kueseliae TaxID=2042962 RepID=A0A2U3L9M4_9BACT|nr:hypothetical protein SBA1_840002 [Candidatus Sulfotelmatobacter kueseliae]
MRKKSRMRAPPWKSGASAPRKRSEINAGFSPGGYSPIDGWVPHPYPRSLRIGWEKRERLEATTGLGGVPYPFAFFAKGWERTSRTVRDNRGRAALQRRVPARTDSGF